MDDLKGEFEQDKSNMTLSQRRVDQGPPRPSKIPGSSDPSSGRGDHAREQEDLLIDIEDTIEDAKVRAKRGRRKTSISRESRSRSLLTARSSDHRLSQLAEETQFLERTLQAERQRADVAEANLSATQTSLELRMARVSKYKEEVIRETNFLQEQAKRLESELAEARSQIFALQPYRKDLTPEEVARDFDELTNSIADWADKFMSPVLDDKAAWSNVLDTARRHPSQLTGIGRILNQRGDLVYGSTCLDTDVDIAMAIIWQFLMEYIFDRVLYGAVRTVIEPLTFLENSMTSHVEPKRDQFSVRNWKAEAYNALLSSPLFEIERERQTIKLTQKLAEIFRIFVQGQPWQEFCIGFQKHCIIPATKLHEKMIVSTHHFYCDLTNYTVQYPNGDLRTSRMFFDNLDNLHCENLLQNRKVFNPANMHPKPAKQDMYNDETILVTVVPGLFMRKIIRGDTVKEPTLVRKQHMLVALGSLRDRKSPSEAVERTLLSELYVREDRKHEPIPTTEKNGEQAHPDNKGLSKQDKPKGFRDITLAGVWKW